MIISHKHKFIFLKSRKTAGTSVELALASLCGDDDVIAPIISEDPETFPDARGRNYIVPRRNWSARNYAKAILKRKPRFYEHCPARQVREWVDPKVWDYFKFSIERNPWERYLSQYYWNTRRGGAYQGLSITEHFKSVPKYRLSNWEIYSIGEAPVVDTTIRFENLESDIRAVCDRLGLPMSIELPKTKTGFRPKERAELPDEIVDGISKVCAREIERFGYSFK